MTKTRRKQRQVYFQDIPKPEKVKKEEKRTKNEQALDICMALSRMTRERTKLVEEIREQRTKIYNLSLEINRLHEENERVMNEGKEDEMRRVKEEKRTS